MGYVYYCVFCGFHETWEGADERPAPCEGCGGALRRATVEDYPGFAAQLDAARVTRRARFDGAIPLAVLATAPWVAGLEDALLGVAALFLVLGAALATRAARRPGEPARAWNLYAGAALAGIVALGLAALQTALVFCAGAGAALLLVAGLAVHTHARFSWVHPDRMLAATAVVAPATIAVSATVVADAGLREAGAVVAALVAVWFAAVLFGCGRRDADKWLGARLLGVATCTVAACAVGAVDGAHAVHVAATIVAAGGWLLTDAAVDERPAPTIADVTPADRAPGAEPVRVA